MTPALFYSDQILILSGADAGDLLENTAEIVFVLEAAALRYLAQGKYTAFQHILCVADAD